MCPVPDLIMFCIAKARAVVPVIVSELRCLSGLVVQGFHLVGQIRVRSVTAKYLHQGWRQRKTRIAASAASSPISKLTRLAATISPARFSARMG
mgnify:CR=1 FL=1